jgi:phenylalanine-4-hydroxylase
MALTEVQQLNTAWEKWTEDLKNHRTTLADYQLDLQKAVEERLGSADMPQVEHYYNQLDIQLNNISHLKHEIQELEKLAGWDVNQHEGAVSDVTMAQHDALADRFESLCHTLKELETDFNTFLDLKK